MAILVPVVAAAVLLAVAWYLLTPKYSPNEPQPFPHLIPVLGHALSVAGGTRNPFLARCSRERNGEPFALYVAGRKHYFFHTPADYATIFRYGKALDNGVFIRLILTNWFAHTPAAAEAMTGEFKHDIHKMHAQLLLNSEGNLPTSIQYYEEHARAMAALEAEVMAAQDKQLVRVGLDIVTQQMGVPSTDAYFGRRLREIQPDIMDDLVLFNREGFWPLLLGMPRVLYPRPYAAQDRMRASITKLCEEARVKKGLLSPVIEERLRIADAFSLDAGPSEVFSVVFGLNSNSIPNAYCALLHAAEEKAYVTGPLRAELAEVGYAQLKPAEYATIFPEGTPRLRAFLQESMRYHTASGTIREVMRDLVIEIDGRQWELKKGGIVNLNGQLLAQDEIIHPSPRRFDPLRFLDKSLGGKGENFSKTVKPFGGGSGYCPGRIFAEKQLMALLAAMIWKYDMEIAAQGYALPETSEFERVLNEPDIPIRIKLRA